MATITPPAGWSAIRNDAFVDGTKYAEQYLFYKISAGGEPANYTFTTSVNSTHAGGVVIGNIRESITPTPVDTANCGTGVQTPGYIGEATAPSITTTEADEKVLFLAAATAWPIPVAPVFKPTEPRAEIHNRY